MASRYVVDPNIGVPHGGFRTNDKPRR